MRCRGQVCRVLSSWPDRSDIIVDLSSRYSSIGSERRLSRRFSGSQLRKSHRSTGELVQSISAALRPSPPNEATWHAGYTWTKRGDRGPVASQSKRAESDVWNREEAPVRNYRHSRNADGGLDSICMRCGILVASADDEWSLLTDEHQHVCKTGENPG